MPETRQIELSMIDEPPTPARVAMDDTKLDELQASMATIGLLQAIGVVARDGRYVIEYGHRRFTCACRLGWRTIECKVFTPEEVAEGAAMLAENIYHEELSPAEEALLFREHQQRDGLDEAALCKRFRVSVDYLGDRFRLLRGDKRVFDALLARQIKFGVAREINKCPDESDRGYLLDLAVRCGYTGRTIADMVRQMKQQRSPIPVPAVEPAAPAPEMAVQPYRPECILCGGYRDPWNLESVMIHREHLEAIQQSLKRAALDAEV